MSETTKRPNIFVIVVDCLRTDRCPTDPNNTQLTCWPKLLRKGTYFTQMVSTASVTPVCFASMLSGQYSHAHGIRTITGPAINPEVPTVATVLKENGYSTHAFMTGPLDPVFGLNRGFDEYDYRPRQDWIYTEWGQKLFKRLPDIFAQPQWFAMLHLFEVHYPRQVHKHVAPRRSTLRYDYSWQELDEQLDRILEMIPDDTIVILTGDHGERMQRPSDKTLHGFLYRKFRKKMNLPMKPNAGRDHGFHVYEDLIRVPFLIAGPGIPEGKVIDHQIRQIDMMPTILDLAGLESPMRTHGTSIKPMLTGQPIEELPALLETGNDDVARHWIGLRNHPWKFIKHASNQTFDENAPYLYHVENDLKEKRNVAKENPDISEKMDKLIESIVTDNPMGDQKGRKLTDEEQTDLNQKLKALGYL